MPFFEDTPFIASGRQDVDGITTVAWTMIIIVAIGNIAYHFFHAFIDLQVDKRTSRRRRKIRKVEIGVFFLIALVAIGAVNWLRWEHRRLKLASWEEIEQWRLENPNLWLVGKEQRSPLVEAGIEFTERLNHAAHVDVHVPSASEVKDTVIDAKDSLVKNFMNVPSMMGDVKEAIVDGTDSLKQTYNNARMPTSGEVAEAAKQGAKNVARTAAERAEKTTKRSWERMEKAKGEMVGKVDEWRKQGSQWFYSNVPIPNEHAYNFPYGPLGPKKDASMWDFFKTLVNEASHFWWTQQWMAGYLVWAVFVGIESRNRDLPAFAFIVFGYCFSLAAAQSLYYALLLLKPAPPQRRKQNWMPHQVVALLPIVAEMAGLACLPRAYWDIVADKSTLFMSATVFFNVLQAFLVALPAIIALVIRDYLPLSWGTRRASAADAKKDLLLFCLWPWIEETIEAVQEGADVLQEKADLYIEAMQEGVEQSQEAAEPYAQDLRKRTKRAMRTAEPYLETAQEYVDEGLDQAGRYAKNAATFVAAQLAKPDYRRNALNIARAVGYQGGEEQGADECEDGEWTEVQRGRGASPRKRGRPAKGQRRTSRSPTPAASRSRTRASERESSVLKRRSSRIKELAATSVKAHSERHSRSEVDNVIEPWYNRMRLPSPSSIEVSEHLAGAFEAAAMTWGLFLVGGLGLASSGVFGGDEIH
ncbi:hypothetical protein LTR36_003560 [Oleoguttula mirabilis]|uniref:Uncharacterized protein n=1 Tax=Oleoguttula mirabilis TaxID=1507867 RepID=A0AAV9JJE2_9PEZI|nr:hypothetical protein LTR36_003560 [Oleoguttula mirabilis]